MRVGSNASDPLIRSRETCKDYRVPLDLTARSGHSRRYRTSGDERMTTPATRVTSEASVARVGTAILDQGIWSISNLLLLITVARHSSPANFGRISLGLAAMSVIVGLSGAVHGETYAVRATHESQAGRGHTAVFSSALGLGIVSVPLLFGLLIGSTSTSAQTLAVIAVSMPMLLGQGCLRDVAIADGYPRRALASDSTWLGIQVLLIIGLTQSGSNSGAAFAGAWLVGGIAAWLILLPHVDRPTPTLGIHYMREHGLVAKDLAVEHIAAAGPAQLLTPVVAIFSGLPAAGAVRAVMTLLGPLSVVIAGTRLIVIREVRVRPGLLERRVATFLALGIGSLLGVCLLLYIVLSVAEAVWIPALGATGEGVEELVGAAVFNRAALAAVIPAVIILRVISAHRASRRLRVLAGLLQMLGTIVGAVYWGAEGSLLGAGLGCLVTAPLWAGAAIRGSRGPACSLTTLGDRPGPPVDHEGLS